MKWNKSLYIISILVLLISSLCNSSYVLADEEVSGNDLYALSAVLMDADSGRILFDKNGNEKRANASTTKIMTCILALECSEITDIVKVSSYASKMPDVQLGICEGEEYYLGDLLHSLMLESHNDSAVAIAEHVGGSVKGFAAMMNTKAKEIGCNNTYFITPNGLDSSDDIGFHGTTAKDLALIMKYCIKDSPKHDMFLDITQTDSYVFSDVSRNRTFSCNNHNAFLNMMEGVLSGKTGFTCDAGYCYVGALCRDGRTYIVALLGCGWPNNKTYKWKDSKKLMSYGIDNYSSKRIIGKEAEISIIILKSNDKTCIMKCNACYSKEILLSNKDNVEFEYIYPKELDAPIEKGAVVGYINVYINDELFDICNIYASETIIKEDFLYYLKKVATEFF